MGYFPISSNLSEFGPRLASEPSASAGNRNGKWHSSACFCGLGHRFGAGKFASNPGKMVHIGFVLARVWRTISHEGFDNLGRNFIELRGIR
jgi:hypothetical protein